MLNKDLEIIKKKYGENMMKLCRELFPSILEEEGVLSKIILSNFYPNHNLYDDIIDNKLEILKYSLNEELLNDTIIKVQDNNYKISLNNSILTIETDKVYEYEVNRNILKVK